MKCSLLLLVLFLGGAVAQAAEIHGKVLNFEGKPIAGARVTVALTVTRRGTPKPENKQDTTGPDGTYNILGVGAGTYTLTVALPGSQAALRRPVAIRSDSGSVQLDIQIPEELTRIGSAADERKP